MGWVQEERVLSLGTVIPNEDDWTLESLREKGRIVGSYRGITEVFKIKNPKTSFENEDGGKRRCRGW